MQSSDTKLFDAHLHIIDPAFPVYENQGYLPPTFTADDYLQQSSTLNIKGGAIVSGSFQKQDQSYLIAALEKLGSNYVGVTQLLASVCDEELLQLNRAGVRAVRFNLKRGGSEDVDKLDRFARRVFDLAGWHVELYIGAQALNELSNTLSRLPLVSIDHLGLEGESMPTLLQLAEQGVKVKATGFGRLDFSASEAIRRLYDANPECLMFGTDLPSTRAPRAFQAEDIAIIKSTLDEKAASDVLYNNAYNFYFR